MKQLAFLREFARRLTRGLRRIAECLERDVERILTEFPEMNPYKVADLVTTSLLEWEMLALQNKAEVNHV